MPTPDAPTLLDKLIERVEAAFDNPSGGDSPSETLPAVAQSIVVRYFYFEEAYTLPTVVSELLKRGLTFPSKTAMVDSPLPFCDWSVGLPYLIALSITEYIRTNSPERAAESQRRKDQRYLTSRSAVANQM